MHLSSSSIPSNPTFDSKPQACLVLLALVNDFKMLFHKLFALEVDKFLSRDSQQGGGRKPQRGQQDPALGAGYQAPQVGLQGYPQST